MRVLAARLVWADSASCEAPAVLSRLSALIAALRRVAVLSELGRCAVVLRPHSWRQAWSPPPWCPSWRRHFNPGAARFRQTDGYSLLCRTHAMLAPAHGFDLVANEMTGLGAWRLTRALVGLGLRYAGCSWHDRLHDARGAGMGLPDRHPRRCQRPALFRQAQDVFLQMPCQACWSRGAPLTRPRPPCSSLRKLHSVRRIYKVFAAASRSRVAPSAGKLST